MMSAEQEIEEIEEIEDPADALGKQPSLESEEEDDDDDDDEYSVENMRDGTENSEKYTDQFYRTSMCHFQILYGKCVRGNRCTYAHQESELRPLPNLRKTSFCKEWMMNSTCNKPDCPYAHCTRELQSTEAFFRSKPCAFFRRGRCESGEYCRFSHDINISPPVKRKCPKCNQDQEHRDAKTKNAKMAGSSECPKCNMRKFSTNSAFTDLTESTATCEKHSRLGRQRSSLSEWDSISPSDSASASEIRSRTAPVWVANGAPFSRIPAPQMVAGLPVISAAEMYPYHQQLAAAPIRAPMPISAEGMVLAQLPGGGMAYVQMPMASMQVHQMPLYGAEMMHVPMMQSYGQGGPMMEMVQLLRLAQPVYYED